MNTMIKQIEEKNLAECELSNLCVLPSFRHKGIGEKLLEHAFSVAKENSCKKINIGIVEENKRLKKWYESFGFVHVRTQKFDFFFHLLVATWKRLFTNKKTTFKKRK